MHRHREAQLRKMLDDVFLTGYAAVRQDELYLWLGAKRLTKSAWRQIRDMWAELCEEQELREPDQLYVVIPAGSHGLVTFRRPIDISQEATLVGELAA